MGVGEGHWAVKEPLWASLWVERDIGANVKVRHWRGAWLFHVQWEGAEVQEYGF